MIVGIDEAGKGPVLGPMCVAGIGVNKDKLEVLNKLNLKDSKKLTPKKRTWFENKIKGLVDKHYVLVVSASQIDALRKIMTMNEIMVICYAKVIQKLKPDYVIVDAAEINPERFAENIKKRCGFKVDIKSEHNADEKYSIVAAASILAKVKRDKIIKEIEKKVGINIGSGYPSDPSTLKFLEEWVIKHGTLPEFARSSWATSKRVLNKEKTKKMKIKTIHNSTLSKYY